MKKTLFMLMSLDGKISTGAVDDRDVDKDLPNIRGASEGLHQYYDIEKTTDWYSLNTGKVMTKVGWNEPKGKIERIPVRFVIVDNKPHLTELGVKNLLARLEMLNIVTTNPNHPALGIDADNLNVWQFNNEIDFKRLFELVEKQGAKAITIQSGGDMNAVLLRAGLIDELSIVVAPVLIGGKETPSLIGGDPLQSEEDLRKIKALELISVKKLEHNYLHLRYKVMQPN
jgi:2,5-diamino-6-(ribosylamino)-4(3H)-pyrimidinone 5'-phosphate reductase